MKLWLICVSCLLLTSFVGRGQSLPIETKTLNEIKSKLELLYDIDQRSRVVLDSVQTRFHMSNKEYKNAYAAMLSSDSINQRELIPILEKYGWLGKSQVGEKANDAIFYVVHHSSLVLMKKYIPLMRASVVHGEANAKNLILLEDRILNEEGKPQKNDTQSYSVQRRDGTFDFYADINDANRERRKEGIDTIPFPSR